MAREVIVYLSSNGNYWQASWRDENRKRHKKSIGPKSGLSERQARKLCQQLANEINRSPRRVLQGEIPTISQFVQSYIASRTDIKPTTRYLFELTGRYLTQFFGEHLRIDRITRQSARDWRNALALGECSGGNPMAEVSVCHRTADAKTIFKRAVDDDILPFNPFDRLKVHAPKPDKDWHYVAIAELDKLLAACRCVGWKALISLCRLAGLRRGEAVALPWTGIDWQNRRLTIFAEKTGMKRLVPIVPKLYGILLEAFEQRNDKQGLVCDVSVHCLWRNFTVIRKRAGLPAWDDAFQVMRRNCETDWAQCFPQYVVSEWIGHDIKVSAIHYLQVPEELFRKASGTSEIGNGNPTLLAPKLAPKPHDSS
jgi:integrase